MTAKETVLEHAPGWSEEQARRALAAAEGERSAPSERAAGRYDALLERAAALRAGQTEFVDAVALVREGREVRERRPS